MVKLRDNGEFWRGTNAERVLNIPSPTQEGLRFYETDSGETYIVSQQTWVLYIGVGAGSPLTTKGDIFSYDSSDARLPVGTNGYVLSSDSVETTGLKWVLPTTGVTDHTLLTNIGTNTHAQIDTDLTRLVNTSGTNTGDQDLTPYDTHIADLANPHTVTKSQVGLGNVDNTNDLNKPVSTATQTALDLKTDETDFVLHTGNTSNPHVVTATQVGLGNVDNTTDLNKPVSTATQTELDLKTDEVDFVAHTGNVLNPHTVTYTQVGADPAGTDNSTNVSLAGTLDYLTLTGQEITLNDIDLTTDVTGLLPSANIVDEYLKNDGDTGIGNYIFKSAVNSTTAFQIQQSDSTPVFNVDTVNGRVGIGTNAPGKDLDVVGRIRVGGASPGFEIQEAGGQNWQFLAVSEVFRIRDTTSNVYPIYVRNTNTINGLLDLSGDMVGIGVTPTTSKLHIKGSSDQIQQIIQGAVGQGENLTEWQNSSGVVQASIDQNGGLLTGGQRVKSTETSTTTATMSDDVEIHFCNSATAYTLTLPDHITGKEIKIINKNTGQIALSPTSGNIMGNATQTLNQYETSILVSDGTDWF